MQTKNTYYAASGIANGHWEPTHRRFKLLAFAREGLAKLLGTHEDEERPSTPPRKTEEQRHTQH